MRIGIDAKRIYHNATGLGNGNRTLVQMLMDFHPENTYILFTTSRKITPELNGKFSLVEYTGAFAGNWRSRSIIRDLHSQKIDIFLGPTNEIPFSLKGSQIKSAVLIHDLIFKRYPDQYPLFDRLMYDIKSRFACRNASHIIAASEATKKDIVQFYQIPPKRITVIYQSCDDIYYQLPDDDESQQVICKYALPERYILNVGSIIERKNLLVICKAYTHIPVEERLPVVVVGKGKSYEKTVRQFIQQHNLEKWFIVLNDVPNIDLPALYRNALFTIYPSFCEGFGIPVLESLVSDTPVITSNISSLPEVGGDGALQVDPYDEFKMAEAIKLMAGDSDLRNAFIAKGKAQIQKFDKQVLSDQFNQVFQNIHS